MAEILLSTVINKSVEIAGNLLFQQGTRLYWLKEDIDWLQREMRHIRSYVDDAKAKAVGGDSKVKNLLKDIQQLAGDVENLLDDFLPKIQQSNKFKGALCCLKTVSFADEFAMEIEKIKRRVADIDHVRTTYNITDTSNNNDDCIPLDRRRLFLHADETEVIGLDDDFNMLQAKVLESMAHKIQDGCGKVLALSYNDLPIALRPCFLYFGLYPEDHEICAFDLTNLWIAEKLIVVNSGNRREGESLADDVLNDLVSRNLIQVAKRTYDGRISSCRIHDLLHSLCVELGKESNFFHTEHNAFGDPGNVAMVRRITFYSDINVMNEFFSLNPKPRKLRALFCFIKNSCIFSHMAHRNFKLLQVLVVISNDDLWSVPNTFGNMSCLRYLPFKGDIYGKLPNCMVKLKHLETLDIGKSFIKLPTGVWKTTQLRHLRYKGFSQASNCCFSISPSVPNVYSLPPNNLQTLMWMNDKCFEARLLHRLINLKKLGIWCASDSTVKILSTLSPVPKALEVLKLRSFFSVLREQINLSSYPNIVKLHLHGRMPLHFEAFPPNLVKLTLVDFQVDSHVVAVLKKLPKLKIFKMYRCIYNEEKMDLSDGDSFPQLEFLHIKESLGLSEITCMDDVSMPKLKKLLLIDTTSNVRLSERLAKLAKV